MDYHFKHAFIIGPNTYGGDLENMAQHEVMKDDEYISYGIDRDKLNRDFFIIKLRRMKNNQMCYAVLGKSQFGELLLKTPLSKESMTVETDYEGNENNIIDGVVKHLQSRLGVA